MLFKTASAALAILGLSVASVQAATVTLRIHDVASAKGQVLASLCTEAEFLKPCAKRAMAPAARGVVTLTFKDVPPGRYAGMAFHDENSNKTLDRLPSGPPSEGAAFSRDAMGMRGPPKFSDAVIDVPAKGAAIDINLVYY